MSNYRVEVGTKLGAFTVWAVLVDGLVSQEEADFYIEAEQEVNANRLLRVRGGNEEDRIVL